MTETLIMAVPWIPKRAKRAVELMRAAGAEQTRIVWDQNHDALDTWIRVLTLAGDRPVVILEDDVKLAPRWREQIEAVIAEHPGEVLQFFSMRKADLTVGSRYEPGRTFMMNQCYYLPAGAAQSLLAYYHQWQEEHPEDGNGYDMCMAKWMSSRKMKYWIHVPSLVDHEPWSSELGPRSSKRQSLTFHQHFQEAQS